MKVGSFSIVEKDEVFFVERGVDLYAVKPTIQEAIELVTLLQLAFNKGYEIGSI